MTKTVYRVVTVAPAGIRRCLVSFTTHEGGEKSARAFVGLALEANEKFRAACTVKPPAQQLEIEEVTLTTTETVRIIL